MVDSETRQMRAGMARITQILPRSTVEPRASSRAVFIGICMLMVLVTLHCSGSVSDVRIKRPTALRGVLDCTGWNFEKNGPLPLDGEWEFHWKRLLEPGGSLEPGKGWGAAYVAVPGSWRGTRCGGERIGCDGYATYRLIVRTGPSRVLYALKVRDVNSAYRLWVDGEPLLNNGIVGKSGREMTLQNYPRIAVFRAHGDSMTITLQVSNYDDVLCGITRSMTFGTEAQIMQENDADRVFDVFLFGSLLIMGLYHLGLFVMRKKDPSTLFFGAFCLLMSLRVMLTSERCIRTFLPDVPYWFMLRLEFLTLLGAVLFAMFIHSLYPRELNAKILRHFIVCGGVYGLCVAMLPLRAAIYSLVVFQVATALMACYAFAIMIVAVTRKREGAVIFILGFAMIFAALINDILHSRLIIQSVYLVPMGIFLFIFSQSFILARRFSKSFNEVEKMSLRLAEYSDQLEGMVERRTCELETEKDKLALKNEIMEKELDMARRIQLRLMPQRYPSSAVYSLYRPMHLIGGDYYDFLPLQEPGAWGIFISDVSGHGVPAALVASMIKSILLQSGGLHGDPAALLSHLNDLLYGRTGENFVTAFYGVFDSRSRTIVYSNAGHHPPYVIGAEIRMLGGAKSVPLAIMSGDELNESGKAYRTMTEVLPEGGKLVLYTDGLIETQNRDRGGSTFGDAEIVDTFRRLASLSNREFIEELWSGLVEFSGGDTFEDDVCVICIDF